MKTTEQRIVNVIASATGVSPQLLNPSHRLTEDLGCDSLDLVELALQLEGELGISLDEDRFEKLLTVRHVIDYVAGVCTEYMAHTTHPTCISHHHACECREQRFATLNKCALDAAMELDWIKNELPVPEEKRDVIQQIVDRVHAASAEVTA
jgi:acyl carrier protein